MQNNAEMQDQSQKTRNQDRSSVSQKSSDRVLVRVKSQRVGEEPVKSQWNNFQKERKFCKFTEVCLVNTTVFIFYKKFSMLFIKYQSYGS